MMRGVMMLVGVQLLCLGRTATAAITPVTAENMNGITCLPPKPTLIASNSTSPSLHVSSI